MSDASRCPPSSGGARTPPCSRPVATVLAVEPVTRRMRRLVLGGSGLSCLATPDGALGPYLKFCLPVPAGEPCLRTYSIRRFDPVRSEAEVDIVLHDGDTLGSAFAARAEPGATVRIAGPGFISAAPAPCYLLAGDHSALPAIAHVLDNLADGRDVRAIIEVPDAGEEQDLRRTACTRITWLHRDPSAPSRLAEAVRDAFPADATELLVFAGAEASIARAIRGHVRGERAVPAERCQVLNYWKRGRPEGGFSYVA